MGGDEGGVSVWTALKLVGASRAESQQATDWTRI